MFNQTPFSAALSKRPTRPMNAAPQMPGAETMGPRTQPQPQPQPVQPQPQMRPAPRGRWDGNYGGQGIQQMLRLLQLARGINPGGGRHAL